MPSLSGLLTHNWTLKLSAFGVALLLWVSVRAEAPNRQALPDVPVRVDLSDPQWAVSAAPDPPAAVVRFHGPARELMRLAVDRPSIVIPVDHVESSDTTITLLSQYVRIQDRPGVVVDDIQPATVQVSFEPVRRMDLTAVPALEGELPDSLALAGPPLADPSHVRVGGPASRLEEIDAIPLRPVDLSRVSGSGRFTVQVDTTGMSGLQVQPLQFEIVLDVVRRAERVVEDVVVTLDAGEGWEEDYEVEPNTAAVRLTGAPVLMEAIGPAGLRLVVDTGDEGLPEEPGEERVYPLRVLGVPSLLTGEPQQEEVTVRRVPGTEQGEEGAT